MGEELVSGRLRAHASAITTFISKLTKPGGAEPSPNRGSTGADSQSTSRAGTEEQRPADAPSPNALRTPEGSGKTHPVWDVRRSERSTHGGGGGDDVGHVHENMDEFYAQSDGEGEGDEEASYFLTLDRKHRKMERTRQSMLCTDAELPPASLISADEDGDPDDPKENSDDKRSSSAQFGQVLDHNAG